MHDGTPVHELTPRESPTVFARTVLGVELHPGQSQFVESRAKTKVAACGRQWGKSTAAGVELLWWALTRTGTDQMVLAPTHDQTKIVWGLARKLARESVLADLIVQDVESPFPELRLATGEGQESSIFARSVSAGQQGASRRGRRADRIVVDEAAFIPAGLVNEVIAPSMAASQYGELLLISTPWGLHNYFAETFVRGQNGAADIASFHFPSSSSPYISAAFLERQRAEMTDLAFRTEYLAEFLEAQASVFRQAVIQAAIDETIQPGPIEQHRYAIGYDPAKYADRSGVVVLDVTQTPRVAVEVLDLGGRSYLDQAAAIRRLADAYNHATVLLDATSHDQMLEELKRSGVRAEGYRFTNQSKRDLIDGLVLMLERGDLRIPRHPDLIRELTYYQFEVTRGGNVKLGAPEGAGHFDDLVTALALAVWAYKTGDRLPYAWLRNDPEFQAQFLSAEAPPQRQETDEERLERRRRAYLEALGEESWP